MYSQMNIFSRKSKRMMNGTLQCCHLAVVIFVYRKPGSDLKQRISSS